MREYLPFKDHSCCDVKHEIPVETDYLAILDEIVINMSSGAKTLLYDVLFDKVYKNIRRSLVSGFGKDYKSPFISQPEINRLAAMDANIQRFSAAKTVSQVQEINRLVAAGTPFSELKNEVRKINDQFNVNWLKTETGTAYATGLNVGDWMGKSTVFKFARWRQIQRSTKRESHSALNGKVWRTDEIPAIPPLDWNCGCRLEYFEETEEDIKTPKDFVDELKNSQATSSKYANLYEQMKRYGFNTHKGKTGQVFDLNKTYGSEFNVNRLTWSTQGRASSRNIRSVETMIRDSRSYESVSRTAFGSLSDYMGREITPSAILNKNNYRYIVNIHDVLNRPHEVYLQSVGNSYKYVYFKFYNDMGRQTSIRVSVDLDGNGFKLNSLNTSINSDRYRNGVLVYNSKESYLNSSS